MNFDAAPGASAKKSEHEEQEKVIQLGDAEFFRRQTEDAYNRLRDMSDAIKDDPNFRFRTVGQYREYLRKKEEKGYNHGHDLNIQKDYRANASLKNDYETTANLLGALIDLPDSMSITDAADAMKKELDKRSKAVEELSR